MTIDEALARVEAHAAELAETRSHTAAALRMLCSLVRIWWGKV